MYIFGKNDKKLHKICVIENFLLLLRDISIKSAPSVCVSYVLDLRISFEN